MKTLFSALCDSVGRLRPPPPRRNGHRPAVLSEAEAASEFTRKLARARQLRHDPARIEEAAREADEAFGLASTEAQIREWIDYWAEHVRVRDAV